MSDSIDYQINEEARHQLNAGFQDIFQALKISNYTEYKAQANILAQAFGVSRDTVGRWLAGSIDFVGKGNPRIISGEPIAKSKVFDMRVAFAKAAILGAYLPTKIGDIETKFKKISSADPVAAGAKLREYLANDHTRKRGIRVTFAGGMLTWEYARYSKYPDHEESSDIDDWSTTLNYWNPGVDPDQQFPYAA